jgi:hypothetical protein
MKLYATTTSERASKGQGGNEFIRVELFCGSVIDSELFTTLNLKTTDDKGYVLYLTDRTGKTREIETMRIKGKQKKDETVSQQIKRQAQDDREQDVFESGMQ